MKYFLVTAFFTLIMISCAVEDEACITEFDCPEGMTCDLETGTCKEDAGNTGDTSDTGDTTDTGDTSDTGDTTDTGDTSNTGDTADTGDTGNTADTGNTGTDNTPPSIKSVSPDENEKNVALDKILEIEFSEPIDCSTITPAEIVTINDSSVTVTCTENDPVVTYSQVWDSDSTYKVTVKGAVIKDNAGNIMQQSKNWYFYTADLITPAVIKEECGPIGESVKPDKKIIVVFSEPVKPETVKVTLNTVELAETPVINGDNTVFEWTHALELNTEYTVKVSAGVEDEAGNIMKTEDGHEWTFKTSAYNIFPVVNFYKALIPLPKEPKCDSSVNAFDNPANFQILNKSDSQPVTGTINCDTAGKKVTFVPASQFAQDGEYSIVIKNNAVYSDTTTLGDADFIADFKFQMIIDDDFESGDTGWDLQNNWEVGVPDYDAYSYKITTAKSGTSVMATGLDTEHLESTSYSAKSKDLFTVAEDDQYYIEFWAYVGLENYADPNCGMLVKIVKDSTVKINSIPLTVWGGANLFGDYYIGTTKQTDKAVRGKSADNTYSLFDGAIEGVTSTTGKQFSLWFTLHADGGYAKAGVYLDDVKLYKTLF